MSASNGRVFCFNGTGYVTTVTSDFTLKGSQSQHPNFCAVENKIVSTEADTNFEQVRALLTEHLRVVTSNGYMGPDNACWSQTAAEYSPQQR